MRQRISCRDKAVVLVLVIAWLVNLVAVAVRPRRVVDQGGRREHVGLVFAERGIHRRRIDKRLEHRPGRTPGHRVIELAHAVVATADNGQHFTRVRIHRHQRHLRHGTRLDPGLGLRVLAGADFDFPGAQLQDLLVDSLQTDLHCLRRRSLQIRIERGVDAETVVGQIVFVVAAEDGIANQVDEIGRIARLDVRRRQFQRYRLGAIGVVALDRAGVHHRFQHQISAVERALRMAIGRKIAGRLHQAGKQGRLRQGEIVKVLVEVGPCSFGEAVDRVRAALAQVHLVGVEREDLLLAQLLFQFDGDQHLGQLALYGLLWTQEEHARDLHGDRRASLAARATLAQVDPCRLHDAQVVHSVVLEVAAVLDGDHRVHQDLGEVFEIYLLPLGTLFGVERRDQRRLELVSVEALAGNAAGADDALYLLAGDVNDRAVLVVVRLGTGADLDSGMNQLVRAQWGRRILARFAVTGPAHFILNVARRHPFADPDRSRARVNARRVRNQLPAQPGIDDLFVLKVVVRENEYVNDRDGDRGGGYDFDRGMMPVETGSPACSRGARRGLAWNFYLDGHNDSAPLSAQFPSFSFSGLCRKGGRRCLNSNDGAAENVTWQGQQFGAATTRESLPCRGPVADEAHLILHTREGQSLSLL